MNFGFIKDVSDKGGNLVVGLDVGTTKVCAVVGEVSSAGKSKGKDAFSRIKSSAEAIPSYNTGGSGINIIGIGMAPSKGMKKGVVTNIEGIVESIKAAVENAETMASVDIHTVYMGITGGHIGCLSSNGVIAVKEKEIGQKEVDSVIEAAKAVAIPFDREMLHVIPVGFTVNGQNGITDPRGMGGVRLETDVQIITATATSVQNLIRSCQRAGLEVLDVVFQPLASAEAVLTHDEKELGVAIVDIGGGTTDIALFRDGNVCHTAVLSIGGNNFTNDIAIGMRTPTGEAEKIKKEYGCSMISLIKENEEIQVGYDNGTFGRRMPRSYLVEILQPRAEELFGLIREEITGKGFHKNMNAGVVLTGGAVLMEGMDVMAENILELPVRIGKPGYAGGIKHDISSPMYSTAVGLMLHSAKDSVPEHGLNNSGILSGFGPKVKGWFSNVF